MAGYSGTPLIKKLGIKSGFHIFVLDPPKGYYDWLSPLPADCVVKTTLSGTFDFIHVFALQFETFQEIFLKSQAHLKKDGMLWISWPKKSSKVATDLDENKIRDFGLNCGLVDVEVCAIDQTWSGLKFVVRVKDR